MGTTPSLFLALAGDVWQNRTFFEADRAVRTHSRSWRPGLAQPGQRPRWEFLLASWPGCA